MAILLSVLAGSSVIAEMLVTFSFSMGSSLCARAAEEFRSTKRLDDLFHHLLRVGEEHHGIVAIEELVVDAGIADAPH